MSRQINNVNICTVQGVHKMKSQYEDLFPSIKIRDMNS